ncbi:MAG: RNA-binding protein [Magnetospirillum sp.]|nr:RNA-binding protein [Magnetospirillum sp.]
MESNDLVEDDLRKGPNRRCIVTGSVLPKEQLLRFVVGPDSMVVPDVEGRLPGRGIWLSPGRDVVNTALAKRLFARAARRAVVVPDDLADLIERILHRRCLDALALARRAGQAVAGFEKVKAELKAGRVAVLVQARDAAQDGRDKLKALAPGAVVVDQFDAAEMGAVFGRDHAVHACVAPGGLARRLTTEAALLAGFRADRTP